MSSVPIYIAVATFPADRDPGAAAIADVAVVGSIFDAEVPLEPIGVTLKPHVTHREAGKAIAAALHAHGWRVAGKWSTDAADRAWHVTVELVVSCLWCRQEIWWRIPARLASKPWPLVLGAWCDESLNDICGAHGGRDHEPRRAPGE